MFLSVFFKIKKCPGSAAVHDIQLSQLTRSSFREITKPIAIFQFDWTGKNGIKKNETLAFTEKSLITGSIEMIFMWWDLKMDPKGLIKEKNNQNLNRLIC